LAVKDKKIAVFNLLFCDTLNVSSSQPIYAKQPEGKKTWCIVAGMT
jgi:hypothetical protein